MDVVRDMNGGAGVAMSVEGAWSEAVAVGEAWTGEEGVVVLSLVWGAIEEISQWVAEVGSLQEGDVGSIGVENNPYPEWDERLVLVASMMSNEK